MTHTGTYYADNPRSDIKSDGGFKEKTLEPEAFIVNVSRELRKKTEKYSELEKAKKKLAKERKDPPSLHHNITTIERDQRIRERQREEINRVNEERIRMQKMENFLKAMGKERTQEGQENLDDSIAFLKSYLERHKRFIS